MKTTLSSKLWALKCNEKKVKKTGRGRKRCRRRNKKTNTLKAESVLERKKERKENR